MNRGALSLVGRRNFFAGGGWLPMAFQYDKFAGAELFRRERNRKHRKSISTGGPPDLAASPDQSSSRSDASQALPPSKLEVGAAPGSVAQKTLKLLSPGELHALYAGTTVPPHRYLASALITALHSPSIALDPAKWLSDLEDIDLSSVVGAWLRTNGDTTYEQLKSVGFDLPSGQLTAVLTIKQECGYSGGSSTAGSEEFVAFWVDWGAGFRYEGTVSAIVYDLSRRPAAGLDFCISLPVNSSSRLHQFSDEGALIKVRAVLSWNTPPSTTHPYAQAVWGNSLSSTIAIASNPPIHSGQEAAFPEAFWRDRPPSIHHADSPVDRGQSVIQSHSDMVHLVRKAAFL